MKSHSYEFRLIDVARLVGGLLVPMIIFAVLLRVGAFCKVLPAPWPALDVDHTILTHQAEASRRAGNADLLLIGDSSCLMNVSGRQLEQLCAGERRCINLGSLMYLGLDGYAAMLSRYVSANPGRVHTVVVFLHPEMLRGVPPVREHLLFLSDYYAGIDFQGARSFHGQLQGLFGLHIFQDRLLTRSPLALPGAYGRAYGFNLDLHRFMDAERGSLFDPHQYVFASGQGNAEYRLSPSLEAGCMALRAAVPPGTKLMFGLTPIPQSFVPPGYAARWRTLLLQCGEWLQADVCLTNLPPTMPDSAFASTTHLNQSGARQYTEIFARVLKSHPAENQSK